MATDQTNPTLPPITALQPAERGGEGGLGITLGIVATAVFYTATYFFPHPWI